MSSHSFPLGIVHISVLNLRFFLDGDNYDHPVPILLLQHQCNECIHNLCIHRWMAGYINCSLLNFTSDPLTGRHRVTNILYIKQAITCYTNAHLFPFSVRTSSKGPLEPTRGCPSALNMSKLLISIFTVTWCH